MNKWIISLIVQRHISKIVAAFFFINLVCAMKQILVHSINFKTKLVEPYFQRTLMSSTPRIRLPGTCALEIKTKRIRRISVLIF